MRCPRCGQTLDDGARECTRCATDLTPDARRRELRITLVLVLVAIMVVTALTFVVLNWHDAQMLSRP